MQNTANHRGFTVMETLLVVAIITIVVSIVYVSFTTLNSSQVLDKGASAVLSVIDEARAKTLASKDDSQYGVYFEDTRVVLFKGGAYSSSDPSNVEALLDGRIGIKDINLSGGVSSTVFQRLTGATSQSGSVKVYLRTASTTVKTINISGTGVASVN